MYAFGVDMQLSWASFWELMEYKRCGFVRLAEERV